MKLKTVLANVKWKKLLPFIAIPLAVGGLAAALTMGSMQTYRNLLQPPFSPPGWVFPVAWTMLYILMGWASYRVLEADAPKEKKRPALILYGVQLFFNFFWSLLFFRWELRLTAFFWLLALWLLIFLPGGRLGRGFAAAVSAVDHLCGLFKYGCIFVELGLGNWDRICYSSFTKL